MAGSHHYQQHQQQQQLADDEAAGVSGVNGTSGTSGTSQDFARIYQQLSYEEFFHILQQELESHIANRTHPSIEYYKLAAECHNRHPMFQHCWFSDEQMEKKRIAFHFGPNFTLPELSDSEETQLIREVLESDDFSPYFKLNNPNKGNPQEVRLAREERDRQFAEFEQRKALNESLKECEMQLSKFNIHPEEVPEPNISSLETDFSYMEL